MANIRAFTMPKWGIEMTEGTVAEWMVREGDAFKRGQTLCLIETDKITNEIDAEFDAVVMKIVVPAGGDAQAVGTLLAVFGDTETSVGEVEAFIGSFKAANTRVAAKQSVPASGVTAPTTTAPKTIMTNRPISPAALRLAEQLGLDISTVTGSGKHGRISYQDVDQASRPEVILALKGCAHLPSAQSKTYASPLAVRLAALHGVNLSTIKGTGPRGRISKADVLATIAPPAAGTSPSIAVDNSPRIVPMDRHRKIVARRLTQAKQTIPHFYVRTSVAVEALLQLRKTANTVLGVTASINDYLIRAVAVALAQHRDINVQVHGETIHHFAHADIAIAVASPTGLITPIIRTADLLRVDKIAVVTADLIARAHSGTLNYAELEGGTFCISNLGMFGIEQFDAIINPPQGSILAVGGITRVFAEQPVGGPCFESRMALSLSCDHRAIDGATAARFMATLKKLIETPEGLFC